VPNVAEDFAGIWNEEGGEFAIVSPGADDGLLVDFLGVPVEIQIDLGNIGLRVVQADVALALLLGIVKRMGV
jgi:hypothetical protein